MPPSTLLSPTGLAFGQRVQGSFGYNYGARIADIKDGTSNTLMLSELVAGHTTTIRGAQSYDEGPVFMADHCPNDPTPDIVRWCDAEDGARRCRGPLPARLGRFRRRLQWRHSQRTEYGYPYFAEHAPGRGRHGSMRWQHAIHRQYGFPKGLAILGHARRRRNDSRRLLRSMQ